MATPLAELEEKVRSLSQSDKTALIRLLIGELDGPPEPDIERAWIAEAKRRHQELLEGRVKGIPGEQVFSNVRALFGTMRYEFHAEAQVDLVETILYYETQALGLGERFAAEVQHAIEQLLKHPKIGAPDEEGFRKWVLDTFPYNLRYAESGDLVYILVVESQHRRPGYWKSRVVR